VGQPFSPLPHISIFSQTSLSPQPVSRCAAHHYWSSLVESPCLRRFPLAGSATRCRKGCPSSNPPPAAEGHPGGCFRRWNQRGRGEKDRPELPTMLEHRAATMGNGEPELQPRTTACLVAQGAGAALPAPTRCHGAE
jgi:hypothetical protein